MKTTSTTRSDPERAQALAQSLDCLTEQDLCTLCEISPATAEAWRKRHKGPAYAIVGNRILYPRRSVAEFLERQMRQRTEAPARSVL